GTIVTKFLIGSILARFLNSLTDVPELYLEFARRLDPSDTVITFNYDSLLERALDTVGKPYRLIPTRYKSVSETWWCACCTLPWSRQRRARLMEARSSQDLACC